VIDHGDVDKVHGCRQGMAAYGKPVLLRFAHEMHNQPSYSWAVGVNGNTASDYLAAWDYVHARF
jgi:hypothetical protein